MMSRFNGVYSRDELSGNIKNGAYVINLDDLGAPGNSLGCFVLQK